MAQFIGGPAEKVELVVPNDSDRVFTDSKFQWFYVGGTAGNVVIGRSGGLSDITLAVAANSYHPIIGTHIKNTGTTATPIHAARI